MLAGDLKLSASLQRISSSPSLIGVSTRPETDTPTFAELAFPTMELYAMPAAISALLDDSAVNIDEWIAYGVKLGREQLVTHARRGNREYYVVGMIESTAEHTIDHVDHIRQIRERVKGSSQQA